jgi:outer membrane protein
MKKKLFTHIIIILVFAIPFSLFSKMRKVTLNECITIALQHHPSFRVSAENKNIAFAQYKQFKAQRNPQVSAQLRTMETQKSNTDTTYTISGIHTDINLFGGLSATYNLYDPTIGYKEKTARLKLDMTKISLITLKNTIILNLKKAYYGYLIASEKVKIKTQLLYKYKQKRKQAEILFRSGLKPKLDISKADVSLAEGYLELEKAKNHQRSMLYKLYSSMGVKQSSLIDIQPVAIEKLPNIRYSIVDLKKLAQLYNPEIKMAVYNQKTSRINIDIARSLRLPTLSVSLLLGMRSLSLYGTNNDFHLFGNNFYPSNWQAYTAFQVSAVMPVYTGGLISAKIDESIAVYNKSVYSSRQKIITVNNQISIYYKSLFELKKQLTMTKLILLNAKKHLLLSIRTYENGAGSLLNLKDAQMSVDNAELGYLQVKYQYMITLAELSNIIGLSEEHLCRNGKKKK